MLFTSRPDGLWDYVNPPFCAYTGYPEESLTGLGWVEALHTEDRDASLVQWRSAIGRGTPLQIEHRLRSVDGSHHWVRTHCTPQRNTAGAIARWTGIATPLELVPDVAAERDQRRSAELSRDTVIATAAHELRVPVTILLGQAQIQLRRLKARESVDYGDLRAAESMVDQSLRLAQLISALLDKASIEHGQLRISMAALDMSGLVQRVVQSLQPTLPTHTLRLTLDAAPLWVVGDAMRLEQVLQNLIQNAVTYSPAGSEIMIAVAPCGHEAQIMVRDYGCGIAASDQPSLFRQYFRAEPTHGRPTPGLGLGLYICNEIMALHSGSIAVESADGAGSTFTLRLPRMQPVLS
jgi:PAS domain S-box-containing protein